MNDFKVSGYEDLELSTQLIISEALKLNLKVEILDKTSQFIRLSDDERTEIIKEATKTSADSYITSIVLGDKFITKKFLNENNIRTPKGEHYQKIDDALNDYLKYSKGKWVIKPTTTNFGIGITLLPENPEENIYKQAINKAFNHDQTILIEEFIPGIECRFLVINGICRAVLNRVPANVVGDGQHNIQQLIDLKNKDIKRGKGYKTPLEFLQKSETERGILAEQGLTFKSIPEKNKQIFIRKNSNISTGGDSIDFTDEVHENYKKIAEVAAKSVEAKICGVDVIMSNYKNPANENNHAIIELNYNPVLYFHEYPYKGKNRKTAKYVLELLGWK